MSKPFHSGGLRGAAKVGAKKGEELKEIYRKAKSAPVPQNELLEAAKEAHLAWCTHDKPINGFLFGRLITELDLAIRNAEQGGGG